MRILSFDIEDRMRSLGYYQIAGGLYGLYITFLHFVHEVVLGGLQLLLYCAAAELFIFSIYCGNKLRKSDIQGIRLSKWNQIFQVFQVSVLSVGFSYYSGIRFSIGFSMTEQVLPDAVISLSGYGFRYTPEDISGFSLMINLVPFLIIYWLDKLDNKIEARKALMTP